LYVGPIPNLWTRPTALVIPDFAAADPRLRPSAVSMARFIGGVLQRSCGFKLLNSDDVGDMAPGIDDARLDFSYWRSIKVDIVVAGRLTELADGRLQIDIRMWDVWPLLPPSQLYGKRFIAPPDKVQRLSYVVAGDMYERLCGDDGFTRMPDTHR
jgi:TolB protein